MDRVSSTNWYDFGGLAELRAKAAHRQENSATEVSKQFESLFLNLMLKEMRKSVSKSELLGSDAMESYQQMFDQQVSLGIAKAGGIGIAKYIDKYVPQGKTITNVHGEDLEAPTSAVMKARALATGGGSGG